ncbi:MAG: PKD domain-containing protein, partial [Planctomycetaceae bacterium]|nr:PKD domain-containing protein [Planctomycetaceae bacterium]
MFGVYSCWSVGTLLDALKTTDNPYDWYGNGIKELQRESVAALLNAANPNIEYKYSVQEVIAIVQSAYWTGQYATYAAILKTENAKGGDIQTAGTEQHQEKVTNLQKSLCIKNVVPTLIISGESKSLPNENYVLNLASSDPGDDTITSWTISWGDGTETVVGGNPSSVLHVYDKSG